MASPLLLRSRTDAGIHSSRTSRTTFLDRTTPPCPEIISKVVTLTGVPARRVEPPQIARYEHGEQYTAHLDAADGLAQRGARFTSISADGGGNRICTVLIYLNDVLRGGATQFPRLGLTVRPRKGSAVVFFPADLDGRADPDTLHAALPAVDTKWVAQVWAVVCGAIAAHRETCPSPRSRRFSPTPGDVPLGQVWLHQREIELSDEPNTLSSPLGQQLLTALHFNGK